MMTNSKEYTDYTILHFDDEPANIRPLRRTIFDILCDRYIGLEDAPEANVIAPDGSSMTITVAQRGIRVIYRISRTRDDFHGIVSNVDTPERCVLIFDLMRPGKSGLTLVGNTLFDECKGKDFAGTFFLTAYADRVPPEIAAQIGQYNIWPKPPKTAAFINEVISRLRLPK